MIPIETAWIRQTTLPTRNLAETMATFDAADDWTYSVAWIDCLASGDRLGRSLLLLGEHASIDELDDSKSKEPFRTPRRRKIRLAFNAPTWALNRWSVRAFNAFYYWNGARATTQSLVDWDSFFYPLDAIVEWNRMYGRRGFAQFQCVIPLDRSQVGIAELLQAISASGQASFLTVLKRFGHQMSKFSFPMAGYTLALDFPINQKTLALLQRLDEITVAHGGRFYLAKDSRMSSETLERSDEWVAAFRSMREKTGATGLFASLQSERLSL